MALSVSNLLETVTEPLTNAIDRAKRRLSRYDFALVAIPLTFVGALTASEVAAVPSRSAIAVASVVGAVVLADALFLNPPMRGGRPD